LYKVILTSEYINIMKKLVDSINMTLKVLQNYNDSLSINKRNNENEKILQQGYFHLEEYIAQCVPAKNRHTIR